MKQSLIFIFFCCLCLYVKPVFAAGTAGNNYNVISDISDPCVGKGALLSILDRPTVSDSTCVVKPGNVVIEDGFQDTVSNNAGLKNTEIDYPQLELRFGLPGNNEIKFFPPNYNILKYPGSTSLSPSSGYSDSGIGFKHEFGYTENMSTAADMLITFPSGTNGFQNYGTDVTVNGMLTYSITNNLSIEGMLGISSFTKQADSGNIHRFFSFNPDIVAAYQFTDNFQIYGETFRNSYNGLAFSGNYWFDGGFQYLITQNVEIDVEYGVFLDPPSCSSGHYFGFGTGILF